MALLSPSWSLPELLVSRYVKLRYLNRLAYDIEQLMVMKKAGLDFTLGLW